LCFIIIDREKVNLYYLLLKLRIEDKGVTMIYLSNRISLDWVDLVSGCFGVFIL